MKDTIRQLSRRLGVSTDTIRHYREIGMIHPDIQPNGYCLYDEDDLIRILSIREMRSMDISLPEAKDFVCQKSVTEYNDWLALREQSLRHQIYDLELRLSRLKETQVYASCGVRLMNGVEEFETTLRTLFTTPGNLGAVRRRHEQTGDGRRPASGMGRSFPLYLCFGDHPPAIAERHGASASNRDRHRFADPLC